MDLLFGILARQIQNLIVIKSDARCLHHNRVVIRVVWIPEGKSIFINTELATSRDEVARNEISIYHQGSWNRQNTIRKEEAATLMIDTIEWQQRLYLPPERLREKSQGTKFTRRHDVYSLGVVLLEIAMWENFADGKGRMGKHLKAATDPSVFLTSQVKQVPRLLGSIYGDAVLACLRMLRNEDNDDFELIEKMQANSNSVNGLLAGVRA
ncbi:hypothetical protein MMC22_007392 [Lobaria immixta]|nr:hypothetical protein [Lobaria immixta]